VSNNPSIKNIKDIPLDKEKKNHKTKTKDIKRKEYYHPEFSFEKLEAKIYENNKTENDNTFVKIYTLSDSLIDPENPNDPDNHIDPNNIYYRIIYVLHEVCMQYYAFLLLKQYQFPDNTFKIRIPRIHGIYIKNISEGDNTTAFDQEQ
jgi:hypothetical protein